MALILSWCEVCQSCHVSNQTVAPQAARQVSLAALCWLADRTIDTEGNATPLMAILKAFNVRCVWSVPRCHDIKKDMCGRFKSKHPGCGSWADGIYDLLSTCALLRSLEAFMREIPVALARAAPVLATDTTELQNRVRVRGLQSVFVYSKVLAKKTRVRSLFLWGQSLSHRTETEALHSHDILNVCMIAYDFRAPLVTGRYSLVNASTIMSVVIQSSTRPFGSIRNGITGFCYLLMAPMQCAVPCMKTIQL